MRLRTWGVAALGLASLVITMAVSMLASARTAQDIYSHLDELNNHHRLVAFEPLFDWTTSEKIRPSTRCVTCFTPCGRA